MTELTELRGVGPRKAERLQRLSVHSIEDLLYLFPRDYEDRTAVTPIAALEPGRPALTEGTVQQVRQFTGRSRTRVLQAEVVDGDDHLQAVYFNAYYLSRSLRRGEHYYFYGTPQENRGRLQMIHPEFSGDRSEQGILPVYPLTAGIRQPEMRRLQRQAAPYAAAVADDLPAEIIAAQSLCSLAEALSWIHFPPDREHLERARQRLIFDELFVLQIGVQLMRRREERGIRMDAPGAEREFVDHLPFTLTGAQVRTAEEIVCDMASDRAMNRLVQGDVGSGKTAIAEIALYKAVRSGRQGALMAPTDLLMRQHLAGLERDFAPLHVSVGWLSGHMSAAERSEQLERLADGRTDIVIGTHALLQPDVAFHDLGLVVTDEQHRFGVNQRASLIAKGSNPDILIMTATPIPRTMAMALYGDLDVSAVDELPPGRQPVRTRAVTTRSRDKVYRFVGEELHRGRQAFVVAPLISESDAIDAAGAEELAAELRGRFPDFRVALLHGAMKQEEKDEVMRRFQRGEIDLLAATVVIEVGINIPNATVMVIENAERFGLAQLHQLRGRVGRGGEQSYCVLVLGEGCGKVALERARVLCESSDGFAIAEKDLALRGPGEVLGTRQHGLPDLHLADLMRDRKALEICRRQALRLLADDPGLERHPALLARVRRAFGDELRIAT